MSCAFLVRAHMLSVAHHLVDLHGTSREVVLVLCALDHLTPRGRCTLRAVVHRYLRSPMRGLCRRTEHLLHEGFDRAARCAHPDMRIGCYLFVRRLVHQCPCVQEPPWHPTDAIVRHSWAEHMCMTAPHRGAQSQAVWRFVCRWYDRRLHAFGAWACAMRPTHGRIRRGVVRCTFPRCRSLCSIAIWHTCPSHPVCPLHKHTAGMVCECHQARHYPRASTRSMLEYERAYSLARSSYPGTHPLWDARVHNLVPPMDTHRTKRQRTTPPPSPTPAPRTLNEEQLCASALSATPSHTHPVHSTLVVGGPGSGKTEVLIAAVNNALTAHAVDPSSIIVNTYTQTVAAELRERLARSDDGIPIGTMHSIAYLTMREQCAEKRLVMSEEESKTLMDMATDNLGGHTVLSHTAIELASAFRSNKKGTHRHSETFPDTRIGKNTARIWGEYCRLKRDHDYLDFDDLLEMYRDFLAQPASQAYRDGIQYVFIDEVQDNSPLQNEILGLLHAGGQTHIYAIGDDYQSIYGFRGSDHNSMDHLRAVLQPCTMHVLKKNYRNPRAVIQVSKSLITDSGCADREMQCTNPKDHMYAATKSRVPVYRYPHARLEWAALANTVRSDHRAAIEGCPASGRVGLKQPTQLILARTNATLDGIEEFLRDQGVPYYRQQNMACGTQREFMSLLYMAADKNGHLHTSALLSMGYTRDELDALVESCETEDVKTVVARMLDVVYTREERRVADLAPAFQSEPRQTMHEAFARMDTVPSLAWKDAQNQHATTEAKFDALVTEHAKQLRQQMWVASVHRRLGAICAGETTNRRHFISQMNIMSHDGDESKNMLRLMTIHQSKGLEADYVYVAGAHMTGASRVPKETQEEVRVYNVAFTRCIQKLRVSWSKVFHKGMAENTPFYGFKKECFLRANYV